jgi:hypothetical protein
VKIRASTSAGVIYGGNSGLEIEKYIRNCKIKCALDWKY